MGQRQASDTPKVNGDYKYPNLVACEEHEDFHVVKPNVWPPPRIGHFGGDPSLSAVCELCGCNLVVYQGHATGEIPGIKVILPKK